MILVLSIFSNHRARNKIFEGLNEINALEGKISTSNYCLYPHSQGLLSSLSFPFLSSLSRSKGREKETETLGTMLCCASLKNGFALIGLQMTSTKVNTPTNHNSSKQRNEAIGIPWNYLKLAQTAGKIARTRCDWFWLKNWREIFKPIAKRRNRQLRNDFLQSFKRYSILLDDITYVCHTEKTNREQYHADEQHNQFPEATQSRWMLLDDTWSKYFHSTKLKTKKNKKNIKIQ